MTICWLYNDTVSSSDVSYVSYGMKNLMQAVFDVNKEFQIVLAGQPAFTEYQTFEDPGQMADL